MGVMLFIQYTKFTKFIFCLFLKCTEKTSYFWTVEIFYRVVFIQKDLKDGRSMVFTFIMLKIYVHNLNLQFLQNLSVKPKLWTVLKTICFILKKKVRNNSLKRKSYSWINTTNFHLPAKRDDCFYDFSCTNNV